MGKTYRRRANKHTNMIQQMRRCRLGPFYGRPRLAWWENNEYYDYQKEKQQENEQEQEEQKEMLSIIDYYKNKGDAPTCDANPCCTCNSYGDWWDCKLHDPIYKTYCKILLSNQNQQNFKNSLIKNGCILLPV